MVDEEYLFQRESRQEKLVSKGIAHTYEDARSKLLDLDRQKWLITIDMICAVASDDTLARHRP